jgi:NADPH:quinone reductase-like Zn-dependent oxidoreductase
MDQNVPRVTATAVRLHAKAAEFAALAPTLEPMTLDPADGMALVAIAAAAVNPSDVKAALGLMPYAVFPRTPGRDFAGTVIEGPSGLVGSAVFGSSGDLGIRRDGTHATHLLVEADALVLVPEGVGLVEAAGIGVPFVTAAEGFRRAGLPQPGDTVLIMGVNGKVGQAAAQIATWRGAHVVGAVRKPEPYAGHATAGVTIIDSSTTDVAEALREATGGHGADIVFNTVGEPYFDAAHRSLAKGGRQILIASTGKPVAFNIFEFYRGRHTYVGIDTLALSSTETAAVLRGLLPGFATGALQPFPITAASRYTLNHARDAYAAVMGSSRDRVVLVPAG